jgi:hypothetical protein
MKVQRAREQAITEELFEQARKVLPFLLATPAPCDAVLLTKPVAMLMGAERAAALASEIVSQMITVGAPQLLARQNKLRRVKVCIDEAFTALKSSDALKEKIAKNNQDMQNATVKLTADLERLIVQLENATEDYKTRYRSDDQTMFREDALSILYRCDDTERELAEIMEAHKRKLQSRSQAEWHLLSGIYTSKPVPPLFIELMKVVLNITDYAASAANKSPAKKSKKKDVQVHTDTRCV